MEAYYNTYSSETDSVIRLNLHLQISSMGPSASELIQTFFPDDEPSANQKLPFVLQRWMVQEIQNSSGRNPNASIKKVTTFQRHGRILVAILLRGTADKEYFLDLQEDHTALDNYLEIKQKLTRRQLEMYHIIKDGERNIVSIANKMGISVRTAEGHKMNLQRIVSNV